MDDTDARMRKVIEDQLPRYGRFQFLGQKTSIKVSIWKSWWAGRQRPTASMLSSLSQIWPEHAFWLVTGKTPRVNQEHKEPTQKQAYQHNDG